MHQPCNEPCSIAITSYNRLESCLLGSLAEAALHTGKNDSEYHMQVSRRRQRENLGMSARAAALSSAIYPPNARQGSTNITT